MNNTQLDPPLATLKKRRVFWWVFLAIQILFLVWIITGATSNSHAHCQGLNAHDCAAATDTGTAIGVGLIIALWVAADVILGVGRFIYVTARRRS